MNISLECGSPAAAFQVLPRAGARLTRRPPPQPPHRPRKQNHRKDQPPISWRNSNVLEHDHIPNRHQRRRNQNDVKTAIHSLTAPETCQPRAPFPLYILTSLHLTSLVFPSS